MKPSRTARPCFPSLALVSRKNEEFQQSNMDFYNHSEVVFQQKKQKNYFNPFHDCAEESQNKARFSLAVNVAEST